MRHQVLSPVHGYAHPSEKHAPSAGASHIRAVDDTRRGKKEASRGGEEGDRSSSPLFRLGDKAHTRGRPRRSGLVIGYLDRRRLPPTPPARHIRREEAEADRGRITSAVAGGGMRPGGTGLTEGGRPVSLTGGGEGGGGGHVRSKHFVIWVYSRVKFYPFCSWRERLQN